MQVSEAWAERDDLMEVLLTVAFPLHARANEIRGGATG